MGISNKRMIGFDLARALAIFGMVVVNYKIALHAEESSPQWLDALTGLIEGRAAAIFVILAGIGISLMSKKAWKDEKDRTHIHSLRQQIWKRSFFLLILGTGLYLLGWSADILHYYAVYLFIASFFLTSSSRVLLWAATCSLLIAQLLQFLGDYTYGWDSTFQTFQLFWSPLGFLSNLFYNGYHPIFPWIAFVFFGMWLGRFDFNQPHVKRKLLFISTTIAILVQASSYLLIQLTSPIIGTELAEYFFTTKPMPPTLFYMIASSSTSVLIILLCIYLSEQFRKHIMMKALVYTGQLALTHYVGHFLFLVVLYLVGVPEYASLPLAVGSSLLFFTLSIVLSYWWRTYLVRGPIEYAMRKVSG
ncbi:DUF418 domain-containing protein [Mechercharimyces sp. CAU 1602]|uniref:DUF418 domain-containing protein n=1 Tax=Mechercharimyces sp. CAU 1602 TaxID=2973933 RepID=UPI0021623E9A|nr:heparan-alpha-glucosaminide N-acetyltransferase domain-containing protein [Mechercharimyces sp. CAU 1602]MCS1352106.1 heparan-alpha-glucosaminide N-acetyltransferase domain-containing protein [Mechercharimyces sp. CAU 1602]